MEKIIIKNIMDKTIAVNGCVAFAPKEKREVSPEDAKVLSRNPFLEMITKKTEVKQKMDSAKTSKAEK